MYKMQGKGTPTELQSRYKCAESEHIAQKTDYNDIVVWRIVTGKRFLPFTNLLSTIAENPMIKIYKEYKTII